MSNMELWYTENQTNNVNFSIDSKIASILIVISPFLLHFLVYFVLPPYFV